jgi:HEAT repeat protein
MPTFEELVQRLKEIDSFYFNRKDAATQLGRSGDPRAVAPLCEALGDPVPYVRQEVAHALAKLADPEAVEPLSRALASDTDEYVRRAVAQALGVLADERSRPALQAALDDPSSTVRWAAADALKKMPAGAPSPEPGQPEDPSAAAPSAGAAVPGPTPTPPLVQGDEPAFQPPSTPEPPVETPDAGVQAPAAPELTPETRLEFELPTVYDRPRLVSPPASPEPLAEELPPVPGPFPAPPSSPPTGPPAYPPLEAAPRRQDASPLPALTVVAILLCACCPFSPWVVLFRALFGERSSSPPRVAPRPPASRVPVRPAPRAPRSASTTPQPRLEQLIQNGDLLFRAPAALWANGVEPLTFGAKTPNKGWARYAENVRLDNGQVYPRVLETHPRWTNDGVILGRYPRITIPKQGAEFRAMVRFIDGARYSDGVYYEVWGEFPGYRGIPLRRELYRGYKDTGRVQFHQDLSRFRGMTGNVVLSVHAGGRSSSQDWAAWIDPQVALLTSTNRKPVFVGGAAGAGRKGKRLVNPWGGGSPLPSGALTLYLEFASVNRSLPVRISSWKDYQRAGHTDLPTLERGQTSLWHTLRRDQPGQWAEKVFLDGAYVGEIRYAVGAGRGD